jgi:hypothetical protein
VKGVISVALQPDAVKRWGPNSLDEILNSLDNPRNLHELFRISTLIDSHDVHFDLEEQNSIYPHFVLLYSWGDANVEMNSSHC